MSNALQTQQAERLPSVQAGFFDLQAFELIQRVSKAFASSDLVPKQYQGNLANCMIAMDMAQRIGANPLMVMQNLYVVHGTPGWSSKFLVATINACGRYNSMRYEWRGKPGNKDYGCRAWTIEKSTGERLDGIWVDWAMVNAEGWASKNGSKWKTMPDQMFIYRAAAFWQRAYAPELGMGLTTAEELHDVVDVSPDGGYTVSQQPTGKSSGVINAETGEITPTALPPFDQARFEKALPGFADAVLSGQKTVDDILAMAAMKGSLSEEQVAAIRAIDRPAEQTQNDMAEHADFLAGFDDEGAQQ